MCCAAGVAAAVVIELGFRVAYYQMVGKHTFATVEGAMWVQQELRHRRVAREVGDPFGVHVLYREAREMLRGPDASAMRAELERVYAEWFLELVRTVGESAARFVVVDFVEGRKTSFGAFVADVAARAGVPHIDVAAELHAMPAEVRTLAPADGHYTRYANLRVAALLAKEIEPFAAHRSGRDYPGEPVILGDGYDRYPGGGRSQLVEMKPGLAFCLLRDRHGFRSEVDLEMPKSRCRVLCLGDSFTFGDHLNHQDTAPAALARLRPDWEIVNAGISGYTICDEARLFATRARFAAADVVVLQVCENDLVELLSFVRAPLARTPVATGVDAAMEQDFLAAVRRRVAVQEPPRRS